MAAQEPEAPVEAGAQLCPACDSPEFKLLFITGDTLYRTTQKKFKIVECSGCELVRLHPRPGLSELRRYYPENYWFVPEETAGDRLIEKYRRLVLSDHVSFVRRAYQDSGLDGPVLDVGCGGGLLLRLLKEQGTEAMGLDFSEQAARSTWKHNGVPAVSGNLESAPLPNGSCAVVTMFHVLEHLLNPDTYLNVAYDLLKPGGRLVVQVPNIASWQFLLFGENWSGIDVPRHILDFRPGNLETLLNYCGFDVLRWKHFSLRDNPAAFATSCAPGLDPMARRIRGMNDSNFVRILKDLTYFGLVISALPFAVLESLCRAGSTVMVEARKRT